MKKIYFVFILLFISILALAQVPSPYINRVYDYRPAPGQFVNKLPEYDVDVGDTHASMVLKAEECIKDEEQVYISLGGFGGYVVFGFDHMVPNVPGKYDFRILANAFYANANPNPNASPEGGSCESGIVMVSQDVNGNGLPDDPWYEIAGSEYHKPQTIKNYEITYYKPDPAHIPTPNNDYPFLNDTTYIKWKDNQGDSGYISRNTFHDQSYYPMWIDEDSMVFKGTLLADNYVDESGQGNYYVLYAYRWGYCDNHPNEDDRSCYDISWAVDSAGNLVSLPGINFVKVYTGLNQYCGWLGETSTEVIGAEDLHLLGRDIPVPAYTEGVKISHKLLTIEANSSQTISAIVYSSNPSIETVSWHSTNPSVATVDAAGVITAVSVGEANIVVTTNQGSFTDTCTVTVTPILVTSVSLNESTLSLAVNATYQLIATVLPESATNKVVTWESGTPGVATVDSTGLVTAVSIGETNIVVTTVDGSFRDTCVVNVVPFEYTEGVFIVNEDWFGHVNSTVNFLGDDGTWHYRIYQQANPGKQLGCTSQYGTIYGDKFYIVSKQEKDPGALVEGSRLAVCNAKTMESLAEFTTIGGADGRSFLGVNEHKGYIGTSNGMFVFDIDNMTIGSQISGTENTTGSLYTAQIGTMIRANDKVFAVHQEKGLLVIDIENDSVVTILKAPKDGDKQRGYGSIVLSKDGNLWLSVAQNINGDGTSTKYMLKLDPRTMDTTRIGLPTGGQIHNSWYAWTADGFCASTQHNKLYWKNDAGWGKAKKIYEYDIDNNSFRVVLDLATYEPSKGWGIYGAGFRIDPSTDEIYVSLYRDFGNKTYKVLKVDIASATITGEYPMTKHYWFPAMPVFPDIEAPVVSWLTELSMDKDTVIYLGDKVSDADNMQVSIVKTLQLDADETLISASISNDSLYIVSHNTQLTPQTTSLTINFNSNGKLVSHTVQVTVAGRDPILATSVGLSESTLSLMATTTHQLTATVLPDNADNKSVTWESSAPSVATVDATGLVTAVTVGEANIIVTTVDGSFRDTCVVTVTPILVTSVSLSESALSLVATTTHQLTATVLPDNAHNKSVTWESSNAAVATVDAAGLVTAVTVGEANIIVTTVDGSFRDTCVVTVTPILVTSVSLSETTLSLMANTTHQLTATVLPDNAHNKSVTWESSNAAVATVDATGLVTAVTVGEANIVVTTVDGSFRDTCAVTVTPILVTSVSLSESALSLVAATTHQLIATVLPDNAHNKSVTWESSNAAVATVDATGLVTAVTVGEANIVVTTVDGSFRDTCVVTVTPILVTSVSLSESALSLVATTTHQLTATVLPDNAHNKSVTWESSNAAVATVDAAGLVTAVTVGEAKIVVTTVDGSFRDTCTVTVAPLVVSVTSVSLSETTLSLLSKSTHQLTATVLPINADNKYVTWASTNPSVATVDATGLVTAVTVGEAKIVVTTVQGSFTDTCVVTVNPILVTSVSLSETTLSLVATTTHLLTATVLPDNADNKNVTWESSNPAVATVDATGLVTAVTVGEANIIVTTVDGSFRDTCAVTVTPILVTSVSLSETTLSLMATTTHQLTATVLPDNAHNKSVTWESSNAAVATVDATGLVTAVTVGEANIVVTTVDGLFTDTCVVTVAPSVVSVTSVSLSESALSLVAATTHQLTATVLPDNAHNKSVTWESSNAAVATVDATGLVTAVTVGEANIVVTTVDGLFTDTCVVTVVPSVVSVTSVSLSETTLSLMATTTHQLTATVLPENAHNKSVTWESSNAAVATVDAAGLVTAVTVGEAKIVVTTVDGSFRDTCTVTVVPSVVSVTSVSLSEMTLSLMATTTHQLTATVLPDNAHNKSVTWESSNAAVATVDATGLVTAVTVGEANIVVTTVDGSFRDTCAVTVTPILVTSVSLSESALSLVATTTHQLTATVLPENAHNKSVTWASTNPAVATVDATGLVTAVSLGEANIIVTTVDGGYTDSCALSVVSVVYTDGVFFVNEDWFGHVNSTVNFLGDDGTWHYRIYQQANPGKELGCTSQYGTIYGDKFYIVSKQEKDPGASVVGSRLAVCNAKTMKSLAEFTTIGGADGRSFLGVNEHKGYIGTSNGMFVFDIDNMTIGSQISGTENTTGSLYTAQIGTMIRANDKVFAVHQQKGLLVIDIENDSVVSILKAPKDGDKQRGYGSIVLSKDGNLWLSVAQNINGDGTSTKYMMKLDPRTMDTTRIGLPTGGQIHNSWYAWTADGFCASTQHNKLYWKNDAGWGKAKKIYEYDIDSNAFRVVLDLATYEPSKGWGIYGAGFRIDPSTDEIYVSLYRDFGNTTYKVLKVDIASATITGEYPMTKHYWFPAMPVFPDIEAPVVSWLTELSMDKDTVIYLGDKVSDADNMQVSIVKTLQLDADETLISASISNDSLYIVSHNTQLTPQTTSLTINFNSNGKLVSHTVQLTVEGRDPINVASVVISQPTLMLEPNATHQLTAIVLPDNADNKNVTWESSNLAVATVDASGLVTAIAAGEANIIVTTEDGLHTDTCAVTVNTVTIPVSSVSLSESTLSLVANTTHQLIATVLPENADNKNVTWVSTNPAVATVDATGLVTAVSAGETKIIVTTVQGALTDTCVVTVTPSPILVTSVSLSETTLTLVVDSTYQLIATVLPENADNKNVTWESSNAAVATVDANGLVTAVSVGEAKIVVTTVDGSFRDTCTVTVTPSPILVTSVSLSETTLTLVVDSTYQLIATVLPDNADNKNVTWESSNAAVATVDANGLVTAVSAGEAKIVVTTVDGSFRDTCTVTVTPSPILVTSVSLSETTLTLVVDSTYQLIATVLPDNADNKNVTWESSTPAVATVDANGLVTAVSEGEAKIVVTTVQGSFRDTCVVNVTQGVGIELHARSSIKVYPTITNGNVNIIFDDVTPCEVQIIDLAGKVLQISRLESKENVIDVSSFKSGMYILSVNSQTFKIFKQ